MASRVLDALGVGLARTLGGGREKAVNTVASSRSGGWFPIIRESFAGAWQQNVEVSASSVLVYHAVFACMTLIASDIAKLRIKLVRQTSDGIWEETESGSFSPVLRKPNPNQNRIQFLESWVLSRLSTGNTVVLKRRDARGVVIGLYVLDWNLVRPLISDSGEVFYELKADNISGIETTVLVPAREIIHDRFNCIFHPLVGLSPIVACGLAATQGLKIQENSTRFFQNGSMPPGMLLAAGAISDETAARLKAHWEENYTGDNSKRVAVLGDGLRYEAMAMKAVDAQLIDQLRLTAEICCSVFHVPKYKVGIGDMPAYQNVQALNVEYYTQCLQSPIEAIELCLDEGLGLNAGDNKGLGTELDVDNLLRMDSVTQMEVLGAGVGKALLAPNDGRRKLDLPPVEGGDTPYLQEQNYSLAALAKRDAREDPFAKAAAAKAEPASNPKAANDDLPADAVEASFAWMLQRDIGAALTEARTA